MDYLCLWLGSRRPRAFAVVPEKQKNNFRKRAMVFVFCISECQTNINKIESRLEECCFLLHRGCSLVFFFFSCLIVEHNNLNISRETCRNVSQQLIFSHLWRSVVFSIFIYRVVARTVHATRPFCISFTFIVWWDNEWSHTHTEPKTTESLTEKTSECPLLVYKLDEISTFSCALFTLDRLHNTLQIRIGTHPARFLCSLVFS